MFPVTPAAKEKTDLSSLAAFCLPETRVWGLLPGADTGISGSCWITSTLRWGCEQAYDGTVSGPVVGLDYAQNRYYSSILGRFLSADPSKSNALADPGQWNKYAYVGGDPVNFNDPTGMLCFYADQTDDSGNLIGVPCEGGGGVGGDLGSGVCSDPSGDQFASGGGAPYCPPPPPPPQQQQPPPCPLLYQQWINAYGADANATGLSEPDVLALSAIESGWGGGRFAMQGNDFFNLETLSASGWKPGMPLPGPKYAYQISWLPAKEPFARGPNKGRYSLVATYSSASDSFKSFAAALGKYFQGVTDPATFGSIAVANGEYGGRGAGFVNTADTFMDCLK
jgi:RHS repeat-associated protein